MARARTDSAVRAPAAKAGQAMVETAVVLVVLIFAFFAVFQFADNLRAKLLVDYAALRCARARAVGYNDYKLLKTARLATLTAAGKDRLRDDDDRPLSTGRTLARMDDYLRARYDGQARHILDYDYWNDGLLEEPVAVLAGRRVEVTVCHHRPQFYAPWAYDGGDADDAGDAVKADVAGTAAMEAHYPDYLE